MRKPETLDFKSFVSGTVSYKVKGKYRTVIKAGLITLVVVSALPIPPEYVHAATDLVNETGAWDKLVGGLVRLLDPVARIFGVIAGIAIMTGNGKIGLERLFWLSLGYLTARKVEDWIMFLNTL